MPEAVDRHELQRLVREEEAQLVEVLPKEEYDEEHLPGAISIPLRELDRVARDVLDPARPVIVYCWDDP
jgi:rhodanese-related sulfurtransferase